MKPIQFPDVNNVYAKDQPQYLPLPVHYDILDSQRTVTSCWRMTFWQRLKTLWTGCIWVQQMTFGSPLQPQRVSVDKPKLPFVPTQVDTEGWPFRVMEKR